MRGSTTRSEGVGATTRGVGVPNVPYRGAGDGEVGLGENFSGAGEVKGPSPVRTALRCMGFGAICEKCMLRCPHCARKRCRRKIAIKTVGGYIRRKIGKSS